MNTMNKDKNFYRKRKFKMSGLKKDFLWGGAVAANHFESF